jgi:hypothetical protein
MGGGGELWCAGQTKKIWWPMPLIFIYYFTYRYIDEYILHTVILLGVCIVVWTISDLEACLFGSCMDVIVVRVKVSSGIMPFSPMGIDSANISRLPIQCPMGRFVWTNLI